MEILSAVAWMLQLPFLWYAIARRRKGKPGPGTDYVILYVPLIAVTLCSGGMALAYLFAMLAEPAGYWVLLWLLPTIAGSVILPFIEPTVGASDNWKKKWLDE
ncbi:hypothetical protein ASU33_15810 [Solirubrum puertoriconensis]|uniref:Uncharacterized protein n=1 Tax=Solirubrum puertoriconensis TaxID=1751427 RepID=A0A9X0HKV5_SOLP1|nr:hypothetical protein ASU33_15810 [Solirubrum puertoriconensis]